MHFPSLFKGEGEDGGKNVVNKVASYPSPSLSPLKGARERLKKAGHL